MEIRVLKYFLTVVREQSITKAAEVLHITQPTLSRQLAQLEDEIGVKLFDRGSRRITLTGEGLPLILPRRPKIQGELASWFGDYYDGLDVLFTSNLNTNAAVMVSRGLGYSIVIEGMMPFRDQSKITYRPLYPPLTATSVLAWKRGQPFSPAATKFIEHIKCFFGMGKI